MTGGELLIPQSSKVPDLSQPRHKEVRICNTCHDFTATYALVDNRWVACGLCFLGVRPQPQSHKSLAEV